MFWKDVNIEMLYDVLIVVSDIWGVGDIVER